MGTLLKIKNLSKIYYEGMTENRAVNNVNLEVAQGEFVMIMGASGSGKTSLLHLIAGIDSPDEGEIRYRDVDFNQMGERKKAVFRRKNIGLVFQQQCLIPDLTVYENIMLPMMLLRSRKERAARRDAVLKLCEKVGLKEQVRKYPSQLSGGQQQRVAILRAMVNSPTVLLCDEPTGSLNRAQSEIVMKLLSILNRSGQTIILVTHDVKVAARGKRILYIQDGRAAGELRLPEENQNEAYERREEEIASFLQKRGW